MIKINDDIVLKSFNLDKFDFVYESFKELVNEYEDLTSIDINKVLKWEKNKILNKSDNYYEIHYKSQFAGVIRCVKKDNCYDLDDFYVVKKFRGISIGGTVLKYFINVAKLDNLSIELCILRKI
jgi:hypothetical protein